ncbi:DNA damage-inducible protein 1 [Cryptococcus neoformans C23]|nr:DNA damage-inducible protein 1 [Cryptococcus neoformans var. grubii AD2-60a]OWZ46314.1 DNA damage-inducible protein 1 [Cryptococcus neoformans var. grubii C23]OXC85925.1 DNA damage-inducible protein 1 [Cryptococcus neoformans var. grubii AD1-7a]OXG37823.1 DNA damage-inducible protein 1 [Cryptococcus neoformans var. grubii Bt15]OXH36876.1 DNA damage-inducible protein 1 [Cryptococcus neoformans var. grubii]
MTVEVVLVDIIERRIQERMAGEFYPRFLIQLPSSPSLAYTSVSQPTMRLTIIAPDSVHEHEVSPSLLIQDIINIIEATADLPPAVIVLTSDAGTPLTDPTRTLESYGLNGETATILLTPTGPPVASSSSIPFPDADADIERMRLQALGNPSLMNDLRERDPETFAAIQGGTQSFKKALQMAQSRQRDAEFEKQRQIEALNADPYDIDAQKKIEEAIRMEAVLENMQHAMEYSPESFGNVTMLYINVEVNGHPVKAFVDSGAQTTIISPECAEQCGIMRLLDTRFAGMAEGVGTARILGRIHSAQIKLGSLYLPCAFSVLEGRSVDLLFGLDMLKRHQCCIDLSTNTLRINNTEVPFLAEHELPDKARRRGEAQVAGEMGDAAGQGVKAGVASPEIGKKMFPGEGHVLSAGSSTGPGTATGSASATAARTREPASVLSPSSRWKEEDIQMLVNLGAPRAQAIQLLEASGGNVDVAASMLFG